MAAAASTNPALLAQLTASGGAESAGFINDLVGQLWPNIVKLTETMTKQIVEPMFKEMLPGPLATLHFQKLDLGHEPIKFGNVDVHKTSNNLIKMDLDLDWDGVCDVELNGGAMVPKIGIEHIKLSGRLSILLGPLINTIPLMGAAQVAFINPPFLKFTYTDSAKIANVSFIDNQISKIIQSVIASMAVLPNRFLVKIDSANDWFLTYQFPLGILRLTVVGATGVGQAKENKGFFKKMLHDEPDSFCEVTLGETWKTQTINNQRNPQWNETHDFLVSDHEQKILVNIVDSDTTSNDKLGEASTSGRELLLNGGIHELQLDHEGQQVEGKVQLQAQFMHLVADPASLNSQEQGTHGVLTILIAYVKNIQGERAALKPSVAVKWGESSFRTGIKSDAPGSDIQNPAYDVAYGIPLSAAVTVSGAPPVRLALMDAEKERGFVEISLQDVLAAPGLAIAQDFQLQGDSAIIRAAVVLRGTKLAA